MNLHNLYGKIAATNKNELGTKLESRKSQIEIYKDPLHFVFEILQNADDHKATEITFDLQHDKLVIAYDGELFHENNVRAITSFEESTSAEETTKVGRFGIGFKSVLAFTATPIIQSGKHHFIIKGLYSPKVYDGKYDRQKTTITLPFNLAEEKPKFISPEKWLTAGHAFDKISEKIRTIESDTLLFTEHLTKIHRFIDGKEIETINKPTDYRRFNRKFSHAGKQHRDIALAFKLDAKRRIVKATENKLFVLFKTEEETDAGFLINAIFRTNPSRGNIDFTDSFNAQLVVEIGELFYKFLEDFAARKNANCGFFKRHADVGVG